MAEIKDPFPLDLRGFRRFNHRKFLDDTVVREETPVVVSISITIEGFETIMKESKIYQFPSQIILHHNRTSSPRGRERCRDDQRQR